MANTVYKQEEVELLDGTTLTLRPLPIKRLRVFMDKMKEMDKMNEAESGWDAMKYFEILNAAAAYAVAPQRPGWEENPEEAEEVLDTETIYKILEVCGGIDLRDPKLIQQATSLAQGGKS